MLAKFCQQMQLRSLAKRSLAKRSASSFFSASYSSHDRCTPSSVNFCDAHTEIKWRDGRKSKFLNAWLRDHCHCSECYDKTTAQRSSDTLELGPSSNVRSTQVTTINDNLDIRLEYNSNSHNCILPLSWLRKNCYSAIGQEERRTEIHHTRLAWDPTQLRQLCLKNEDYIVEETNNDNTNTDSNTDNNNQLNHDPLQGLPVTPYNHLLTSPSILRHQLQRYGIAFVSNVYVPSKDTVKQCKRIVNDTVRDYLGFPRETLWGTLWDTAVTKDAPDTAYTNIALRPHVDCTYLRDPPELQIFLCAEESDDINGGSSTFVDGFRVAEEMYTRSPAAFNFFSKTQLGFQCIQDGVHSVAYGKVFETDPGVLHPTPKDTIRFRYNNDDRSVMNFLNSQDVEEFYEHIPLLLELLRDDHFVLRTRLKKGTMAIVNNHRVLHGRDSFLGTGRNLVGCYAELSEGKYFIFKVYCDNRQQIVL